MKMLVWIEGPMEPGRKVLKPPAGGHRPKRLRFYNYDGEFFREQCPRYWAELLQLRGSARIVDGPMHAPRPDPPKIKKTKKEAD